MIIKLLYLLSSFVGTATALYEPGAWDEFANNFATDLAPLIALFGEQVTKQYLSESTHFLDSIIFGMAPLGILTALVAVIRIYGGPALRAFVGRAQEPHGQAEIEFCTSTSDNVCELWSEGGVCRVFGQPKLLEFFHKPGNNDFYPRYQADPSDRARIENFKDTAAKLQRPGDSNLYEPACFLRVCVCREHLRQGENQRTDERADRARNDDSVWIERRGWNPKDEKHTAQPRPQSHPGETRPGQIQLLENHRSEVSSSEEKPLEFAPYPNLSLNVGFTTPPHSVLLAISVFAILLQSSFFVYATYITFFRADLYEDNKGPPVWAFVLSVVGTALVSSGMTVSAFLIERKSIERYFDQKRPGNPRDGAKPKAPWFEEGHRAFRKLFPRTTGSATSAESGVPTQPEATTIYWLQLDGQRVGDQQFRGFSHKEKKTSYVTSWKATSKKPMRLVLFALLPSVIGFITQFIGLRGLHGSIALFQIAATFAMALIRALLRKRTHNPLPLKSDSKGYELDWQALDIYRNIPPEQRDGVRSGDDKDVPGWRLCDKPVGIPALPLVKSEEVDCLSQGARDNLLFGFLEAFEGSTWRAVAEEATEFAKSLETSPDARRFEEPNSAAMVLLFRSRLSYLSNNSIRGMQPKWHGLVDRAARSLQIALQDLAKHVFSGNIAIQERWKEAKGLNWHTTATIDWNQGRPEPPQRITFSMIKARGLWHIKSSVLEAVLGLWAFSLHRVDNVDKLTEKVLLLDDSRFRQGNAVNCLETFMPSRGFEFKRGSEGSTSWINAWHMQDQRLISPPEAGESSWQRMLKFKTKSRPLMLLAQSIFTIFVSRLASIMCPLQIPAEELLSIWRDKDTRAGRTYGTQEFQLRYIKSITNIFTNSGLGTQEEALICVIPVLVQAGILPGEPEMVETILSYARSQRRANNFDVAKSALETGLNNSLASENESRIWRELWKLYCGDGRQYIDQRDRFMFWRTWEKGEFLSFQRYEAFGMAHSANKLTLCGSPLLRYLREEGIDYQPALIGDIWEPEAGTIPSQSPERGRLIAWAIGKSYTALLDALLETYDAATDYGMFLRSLSLEATMEEGVDMAILETILNFLGSRPDFPPGDSEELLQEVLLFAIKRQRSDIVTFLLHRGVFVQEKTVLTSVEDVDGWDKEPQRAKRILELLWQDESLQEFNLITLFVRALEAGNIQAVRILLGCFELPPDHQIQRAAMRSGVFNHIGEELLNAGLRRSDESEDEESISS